MRTEIEIRYKLFELTKEHESLKKRMSDVRNKSPLAALDTVSKQRSILFWVLEH